MNKVGEPYYTGPMRVTDENGQPVTTLTNGDFTKSLYLNGELIVRTITVQHLANGNYQARFLPDRAGAWTLIISQAQYAPEGWAEEAWVEEYSFRPIPVDEVVGGDPNAILDSILAGDFRDYFSRDFKYLPAYDNNLVYFRDQVVSLTTGGTANFFKLLIDSAQGISPIDITDPPTWGSVNLNRADYMLDADINKAYRQARSYINPDIFENNQVMVDAYFYCTAHYLVMDIRMAESGLDSRGEGLVSNKSVGGVSVGLQIPEHIANDPQWAYFYQTEYGKKYLNYVIPRVIGMPGVAIGDTLP